MLLFVYGTLKKGYGNNIMLQEKEVEFIGKAVTIDSFNLESYGVPIITVPTNDDMRTTAKPIVGEIYNITYDILHSVDILEGHPNLYKRELKQVKLLKSENIVNAYVYLFRTDNLCGIGCYDTDDKTIYITEHGYEWKEVLRCPICYSEIKLENNIGRCNICGQIIMT